MEKEQLIKQIKQAALLRFEMYADENNLRGQPRALYLNRRMQPIVMDAYSRDLDGLKQLLQHQQCMLHLKLKRKNSAQDVMKYNPKQDRPFFESKFQFKSW